MSRIRVGDLAKELNIDVKTAIIKLQELGIQVKNHFNAIDDTAADKLRVYVRSGRNPDKEPKQPAKVVIRRRSTDIQKSEEQGVASEVKVTLAEVDKSKEMESTFERTEEKSLPAKTTQPAGELLPENIEENRNHVASLSGLESINQGSLQAASSSGDKDTQDIIATHGANAQHTHVLERAENQEVAHHVDEHEKNSASKIQEGVDVVLQDRDGNKEASSAGLGNVESEQLANSQNRSDSSTASVVSRKFEAPSNSPSNLAAGATTNSQAAVKSAAPATNKTSNYSAVVVRRETDKSTVSSSSPSAQIISRPTTPGTTQQSATSADKMRSQSSTGATIVYRPSQDSRSKENVGSSSRDFQGRDQGGMIRSSSDRGNLRSGSNYSNSQNQVSGAAAKSQQYEGRNQGRDKDLVAGTVRVAFRQNTSSSAKSDNRAHESGGPSTYEPRTDKRNAATSRPVSFTMVDVSSAAGGRVGDARRLLNKDKDKDKDAKRRIVEEESKKAPVAKGKTRFEDEVDIFDDYELDDETTGVRTVYNLPNRKRLGVKKPKEQKKQEPPNPPKASKKVIKIEDTITVNDLAMEMAVKASAVIKSLMKLGMMATINQVLDADTATLVAQEFGFEVQNKSVSIDDILNKKLDLGASGQLLPRPPVVTIMGHVDHGKTSLLDAIRSTHVAEGEAGGITQHIGAYQIEYEGKKITFLDTPGHEAFTSMRARGAQVTDVVVLVVAADDGVMPQTIEAISHARAANVPIVVAINKIDKHGVQLDRIYRELTQQGLMPEEWGGDNIFVKVSAKTHQGIPELLEAILLQAELLDLKARCDGFAHGVVLEARLDKSRGPVATVLVTEGTLKVHDWIVAGMTYGRVRALFDDRGNRVEEATPSTPVEVLGLDSVPGAGDAVNVVANDSIAKEAVEFRINKAREKLLATEKRTTLEEFMSKMAESRNVVELPLVIKADTQGSVEAICAAIKKLDTEKVRTKIIHSAVGGITETDVTLAKTAKALIIGFNVRPDRVAATVAEQECVDIHFYTVIYELIESVQKAMAGCLEPVRVENVVGHAEVRNVFSVPKVGNVAGCMVTDGKVLRSGMVRILRDSVVIYTGRIASLKRFKDDVKEVLQGFECGLSIENYNDIKVGDVLEVFVIEEVAASLQ